MRAALLVSTALIASALPAAAQQWTGATSTNWFDPTNWNPAATPANGDQPIIDRTTPNAPVINGGTAPLAGSLTEIFIGKNATGTLTIQGSGTLTSDNAILGENAGASGTVTVTGAGSTWTTTGDIIVGGNDSNLPGGTGIFNVQNGGTVNANNDTVISASPGGVGTVTVTGTNSQWISGNKVFIGGEGVGTFNVTNGGSVTADRAYLGYFAAANGTLNISGANSKWTSNGTIIIGGNDAGPNGGTGTVNIGAGGTFVTNDVAMIGSDFRDGVARGTVNVSGANAVWNANSDLLVGENGTGAINIANGGVVNATGQVILGDCLCSLGTITVSGTGSQFNSNGAADALIGNEGQGTFNVQNGGAATFVGNIFVGFLDGSGTINVNGAGSTFTALGDLNVSSIAPTTGMVNVTNGGAVDVTGQLVLGGVVLGGQTSNATVTVDGIGSSLTVGAATTVDTGSALNVRNGATAGLAALGLVNGGVLNVGAGSTVTSGAYTQDLASTTRFGLNSTSAGRLNATTANLAGALQITGHNAAATTYTLLRTTGGITGDYDTVSYQFALRNAVLTNTGNDLILSVGAFQLASLLPPGSPDNALKVANAIDTALSGGAGLPAAFNNVFDLSGQALSDALSQLSGEPATGGTTAGMQLTNSFLSLLLNPFGGAPGGNPGALGFARGFGAGDQALSPETAAAYAAVTPKDHRADTFCQRWRVWGQAYGGYNRTGGDAAAGTHDTSARTYGLATGFDYRLSADTMIGFAVAGGGTSWGLAQGLGGGSADVFQVGLYASRTFGAAYVSGALAYGLFNTSTNRTVTIAGTDQLAARFNAQNAGGRVEAGYRLAFPLVGITPYAALQVQNYWTPAYTEAATSGSNVFALSFTSRSTLASRTELGAWFDKTVALAPGETLALRTRLAWANDQSSSSSLNTVFQSLPGASFTVNGAAPAKNLALMTAGAEVRLANNVSVGAKFDGEFASRSQTYTGIGTIRRVW